MFCSNCGKENADNAKFCSYCGHIFADDNMSDPVTEEYQTTEQPEEASQTWQQDRYEQPAGYAQPQEAESAPDPHKVRPQTSYPSSEDHPIRPEDTIRESNRRYGKRILICAVVAFAALLVLVVFFIARPDLKKSEPVQTTQETAPETAAQPETTAAPAQPAAQSEQPDTTAAAQEPETAAETKQPETTADAKQTETKAEDDDAQTQVLPEGDDQTA